MADEYDDINDELETDGYDDSEYGDDLEYDDDKDLRFLSQYDDDDYESPDLDYEDE